MLRDADEMRTRLLCGVKWITRVEPTLVQMAKHVHKGFLARVSFFRVVDIVVARYDYQIGRGPCFLQALEERKRMPVIRRSAGPPHISRNNYHFRCILERAI